MQTVPRLQDGRWEVSVLDGREEVAYVLIEDRTSRVEEAWTGVQVGWPMARAIPGRSAGGPTRRGCGSPWRWRSSRRSCAGGRRYPPRPRVLLAFSGSYAAFNDANLDVSVPTVYPLLAYLLARALWVAWRPSPGFEPPGGNVLFVALIFLIGFRVALTLSGGDAIDVGYWA